jgi:hypothetical protein
MQNNLNNKAFTLVEVLLYLGLFSLIVAIIYPILTTTLLNYTSLKGSIDLNSEMRNIFLRVQKEIIGAKAITILTDWEVLFDKGTETIAFFLTQPVYLDKTTNTIKGYITNLSIGSISLSSTTPSSTYSVNFFNSSSCSIGSTNVSSIYAFSGYAWSPNIGWIKFRNTNPGEPAYGVCENASLNSDGSRDLRGYAYNDVIGWISFNCQDTDVCGSSTYKVIEKNGYLYGYAWNDVVGWLIFDGKGGRVYMAKKNPYPYYVDLISDPKVFVRDLRFASIGKSLKMDIELQSEGGAYLKSDTVIVLPFK